MVYSVLQSKVSRAHAWETTGEPSDLRQALRTLPAHLPGGWGQGNALELPSPQNPTHALSIGELPGLDRSQTQREGGQSCLGGTS